VEISQQERCAPDWAFALECRAFSQLIVSDYYLALFGVYCGNIIEHVLLERRLARLLRQAKILGRDLAVWCFPTRAEPRIPGGA